MAVSIPVSHTGPRAAVTPDFVEYNWYGRKLRVNLKRCHLAMCQKMLDIDLGGRRISDVFAAKVKISPETLRRFFRGYQLGPTTLNLILKGLDLKGEQVIEEVA